MLADLMIGRHFTISGLSQRGEVYRFEAIERAVHRRQWIFQSGCEVEKHGPFVTANAVAALQQARELVLRVAVAGESAAQRVKSLPGDRAIEAGAAAQLRQVIKGRGGMLRAVIVIVLRPDAACRMTPASPTSHQSVAGAPPQ